MISQDRFTRLYSGVSGCRHLFPRARVRVNVATPSVTIQ